MLYTENLLKLDDFIIKSHIEHFISKEGQDQKDQNKLKH